MLQMLPNTPIFRDGGRKKDEMDYCSGLDWRVKQLLQPIKLREMCVKMTSWKLSSFKTDVKSFSSLSAPSRHTTFKQCRFNVDSTSRRWINVELTLFQRCVSTFKQCRFNVDSTSIRWINVELMLFQRCVPAGQGFFLRPYLPTDSVDCNSHHEV